MKKHFKISHLTTHLLLFFCIFSSQAEITVGYFDLAPYTTDDRGHEGPALQHFREIATAMQVEVQFYPYPLPRLLKMLQNNELDAALLLGKTTERTAFLFYPQQPFIMTQPALVLRSSPTIPSLSVLAADSKLQLAYWQAGHHGSWFGSAKARRLAITGDDVAERGIDMVASGKVDAFYAADIRALQYLLDLRPTPHNLQILPIPELVGLYTVFSKRGAESLLMRYEAALRQVQAQRPLQIR